MRHRVGKYMVPSFAKSKRGRQYENQLNTIQCTYTDNEYRRSYSIAILSFRDYRRKYDRVLLFIEKF